MGRKKKIPRTTQFRHYKINNNADESVFDSSETEAEARRSSQNLNIDNHENSFNQENAIFDNHQQFNSDTQINEVEDECEIDETIDSTKYDHDNNTESIFEDFVKAIDSETINETDLATAYLAAFFNGRTTQDSLSDYLTLSNISSKIKLPTSFNGLTNLVFGGQKSTLDYEKYWFCNSCVKKVDSLSDRHQRSCPSCKSR